MGKNFRHCMHYLYVNSIYGKNNNSSFPPIFLYSMKNSSLDHTKKNINHHLTPTICNLSITFQAKFTQLFFFFFFQLYNKKKRWFFRSHIAISFCIYFQYINKDFCMRKFFPVCDRTKLFLSILLLYIRQKIKQLKK